MREMGISVIGDTGTGNSVVGSMKDFAGALDSNGEFSLPLPSANTKKAEFSFASDNGNGSVLTRFDHANTSALKIKSSGGSLDNERLIAGTYW
ncbi:MAG: hypothetical protein WAQ98_11080 [Blastocatellia bacterium]|jgi:hypothetical protein